MLFRNTPRFQQLLQTALSIAAKGKDFSDQKLVAQAKLNSSKSTLHRFRQANFRAHLASMRPDEQDALIEKTDGIFLNYNIANKLWNYLDTQGFVEAAVSNERFNKYTLYSTEDTANLMHEFYGINRSDNINFRNFGLNNGFWCYKPSFRRSGFTVKSHIKFILNSNDYFSVQEIQRTSGTYETDFTSIKESSEGFGFIKSNRLWVFMRDLETKQPRIFCFHDPKFAESSPSTSTLFRDENVDVVPLNKRITMMYGFLIEGASGNANDAFSFNAVLVADDTDKFIWDNKYPDKPYDVNVQIDVFPTSKRQKEHYKDRPIKAFIPEDIVDYLDLSSSKVTSR